MGGGGFGGLIERIPLARLQIARQKPVRSALSYLSVGIPVEGVRPAHYSTVLRPDPRCAVMAAPPNPNFPLVPICQRSSIDSKPFDPHQNGYPWPYDHQRKFTSPRDGRLG
jgi:hypothetical protein